MTAAPDGDIIVAVRRDTAVVSAGPVHWDVKMAAPRGYSELPDLAAISFAGVPREPLRDALKTVRHAVCKDSGRPQLPPGPDRQGRRRHAGRGARRQPDQLRAGARLPLRDPHPGGHAG